MMARHYMRGGRRSTPHRPTMYPRKQLVHPPWPLLHNLLLNLRRSGVVATMIAPWWNGTVWHQVVREGTSHLFDELEFCEDHNLVPLADNPATKA
jgi:hypothetical protein